MSNFFSNIFTCTLNIFLNIISSFSALSTFFSRKKTSDMRFLFIPKGNFCRSVCSKRKYEKDWKKLFNKFQFLLFLIFFFCLPKSCSSLLQNSHGNKSYVHKVGNEPLKYLNIGQIMRLTADKYPERELIVSCDENIRTTFKEALWKVI